MLFMLYAQRPTNIIGTKIQKPFSRYQLHKRRYVSNGQIEYIRWPHTGLTPGLESGFQAPPLSSPSSYQSLIFKSAPSILYTVSVKKVAIKSYDIFDWTLGLSSGGFSIHVPVASRWSIRRKVPQCRRRSLVSKYGMSPRNDDPWVTSCLLQEHKMD
jgi:hypothetical protein